MSRKEFSVKTKKAAWKRCNGICECGCGQKITGRAEFDHILADGLGGDNSLENCKVLSVKCHKLKTHTEDRPMMAKADRLRAKRLGIAPAKRKWPTKKFNGEINWRK